MTTRPKPLPIFVGQSIAQAEQILIEATLVAHEGDKHAACDALGISVKTLYSRLQVYEAIRQGMAAAKAT